jgi:hypothetical protein
MSRDDLSSLVRRLSQGKASVIPHFPTFFLRLDVITRLSYSLSSPAYLQPSTSACRAQADVDFTLWISIATMHDLMFVANTDLIICRYGQHVTL